MKIKIVINTCIALMSLILVSCSQDEELFSCNKEINAWAKENMADIKQMSRKEWLEIGDINYQQAAYRTYSAEQKQTLWIGKISEVLNDIKWMPQEIQHIEVLLSIVKENSKVFESNVSQKNMDNLEVDLYRWKEYAIEELKWSPELLYALINTQEAMTSDKQIIRNRDSGMRLKAGGESSQPNCDCNSSSVTSEASSGNWLPCVVGLHVCNIDSGCKATSIGCGSLWLYGCNGTCVSAF
ncbi:MAG: bacteriocin fulvocin C-related protein [Prevotellaceae bacterium]|jgi:hypothetical protein|nr:bacteriocin fulvocin C-related protein [Prevotellaceae bacterium]